MRAFIDKDLLAVLEYMTAWLCNQDFREFANEYDKDFYNEVISMANIYGKPATNRSVSNATNLTVPLRKTINEIFSDMHGKGFEFVLGWGTSLAIMGYVDRLSEDIDIFVLDSQFESFWKEFERVYWVTLDKSPVWNRHCKFKGIIKTEIVWYEKYKLSGPIKMSDGKVNLMSPSITFDNKIHAGITREQSRDIYDLAMFRIKMGYERFYAKAWVHAHRYAERVDKCKVDTKLLWVLKHTSTDLKILDVFKKELNDFHRKASRINYL